MTDESIHVAVVDIGSLKNLGWAVQGPRVEEKGADIDALVEALTAAINAGPLALGFEAPMFVPYGREPSSLDKGRQCDGDRAFSAAAGACVLTKALVIVPYILQQLRKRARDARPTFKWLEPLLGRDLLLFEAFVTHTSESSHIECAQLALTKFQKMRRDGTLQSAEQEPTLNLLGAILLRMRWTDDLTVLSEPCLVVRHKGNLN
jgi:hypothetical protein